MAQLLSIYILSLIHNVDLVTTILLLHLCFYALATLKFCIFISHRGIYDLTVYTLSCSKGKDLFIVCNSPLSQSAMI